MAQVERLTEKDYQEALDALNEAFTHKEIPEEHPKQMDFVAALPIMWTREHDYMSRHFAVRDDGKIAALLGVYPLPTVIAGEKVLLGTIGNVGSLPAARGKGYMKQLMTAALEEAERLGMTAARLGGFRSRYNRYGFDHAGVIYEGILTQRNVKEYGPVPDLHFEPIGKENAAAIDFARACQQRNAVYVERETRLDFWCTLRAWENCPFTAFNAEGERVGYISVSKDGTKVAEWGTIPGVSVTDLLAGYLAANPLLAQVTFEVAPYDQASLQVMYAHCEEWSAITSSMFHVFAWDKLIGPLMKLAAENGGLQDGCLVISIQGWGNLKMTVQNGVPHAERTEDASECTLTALQATNWLLGDLPAVQPIARTRPEASWFPLPLSWNGQDRV